MNKPDKTDTTAVNFGPAAPRLTAMAPAASRFASTRAIARLAGVAGLALLFDPTALAQTAAPPVLPVRSVDGLLNGVQAPQTTGAVMSITQTNQRAIIDWQSFNIGLGATVNVTQPAATSILLNRVVAGSVATASVPSTINGSLQANGRIFILDPNGVVLGSTARVNVGGLLAAAMTMTSSDADFVGGVGLTLARDTAAQGAVRVDAGAVIAGGNPNAEMPTGDVVLLGASSVDFSGRINAGNVFIGAGGGAKLPVGDSGFVKLQLTPATSTGANFVPPTVRGHTSGFIAAPGGSVTIAASGDGETPVTWAGDIDASGGGINISGGAVNGTAVDILSQSDTTVPIPVQLSASSISVTGRSDVGTGVSLANANLIGDTIVVRGVAAPTGAFVVPSDVPPPAIGVDVKAVRVNLGALGTLRVAGLGDAADLGSAGTAFGLRLNGLSVATPDGGGTSVTLAGQGLNGTSNAGIVTNNGGGSGMFSLSGQQLASGADVIIGASSTQNGTAFQSLLPTGGQPGLPSAPFIRTTGKVNLRPLGVDLNGNVVEQLDQAIQIESDVTLANTPFVVPTDWTVDLNFDSIGNISASHLVIGSAGHRGLIDVGVNALRNDALSLTLQNQGANSAGIRLQGNATTIAELALLSAGTITQTGTLRVNNLVLQGGGGNNAVLANLPLLPANQIATLAFDQLGSLTLDSLADGGLHVKAGQSSGYDAASGAFTPMSIGTSHAVSKVLINTDVLTLDDGIGMTGSNARLDLVASSAFASPGTAQITTPAGGVWRVWAPSWDTQLGALNGASPTPTMFGCAFGDTGTCSVSQVALPADRSGLFFSQQPILTITPTSVSSPRGRALPDLPYSVSGLVAGNSSNEAVAGALSTTATPSSPEGSYPILPGSLRSPLGYRLNFASTGTTGGVTPQLTLTPAVDLPRPPLDISMSQLLSSTSSDTYGRNLAVPSMCLAPGAARRDRAVGDGVDLLGLEWGRVRLQPQLSSCVEIATDQSCAAF